MINIPEISIVIVSHNEEKNIGECLESVNLLNYPIDKLEIVVVDSSNDRTKEIVRSFKSVRLIEAEIKNLSFVRNLGIKAAKHEYIAFLLDADCAAPSDWLLKLTKKIGSPKVGAVGCNAFPPPDAPFFGKCIACLGIPGGGAIGLDAEVTFLDCGVNYLGTGCTLYKKKILLEVGGFIEKHEYGREDVYISEMIRNANYSLEYEKDAFVYHKTRNTLIEYFKWTFRRGISKYYFFKPRLIKIVLTPFSPVWIFIVLFLLSEISMKNVLPLLISFFAIYFLSIFAILSGKAEKLFPTGRNKIKLLFKRRKRIGVNVFTIAFLIMPLYYFDRLIINITELYCFIINHLKKLGCNCKK